MEEKLKPVAVVLLLLLLLALWAGRSEAQDECEQYYSCQMPEQKIEFACLVEWQWLSDEDEYTFPLAIVTPVGDYQIVNDTGTCETATDDEPEFSDDRIDWSSQVAAIYQTATGIEVYCISEVGDGTLGLVIDETTLSGTTSTCATYYILDDGSYQINLVDGTVYLADNLWFVGVTHEE
jgi:hypothetical protein